MMKATYTFLAFSIGSLLLTACGNDAPTSTFNLIPAKMDTTRDIISTDLAFDVANKLGDATVLVAGSESQGMSLEVEGLHIETILSPNVSTPLQYAITDGRLDIGLPVTTNPIELHIQYSYTTQKDFKGYLAEKLTFLWPAFCGNLYPCRSVPSEGATYTMAMYGVAMGDTAVFPAEIPSDAPSYMPAFAMGDYKYVMLGKTTAGTQVGYFYLPGGETDAATGTKDLAAHFDWYEKTYGAYSFGSQVASVAANWGPGAFGGMEHHPYWHVSKDSMNDPITHAHEAAHGWFGDGVRISCWEDFVLSEGTVSYLAARAIEAVGGATAGQAVWDEYQMELDTAIATEDTVLMLDTCNTIDLIHHPLWSNATYMKGAYFYKAVEAQVGRDKLDAVIRKFYETYKNKSARTQDMIDMIQSETGADISVLVNGWLKGLGKPMP